MTPQRRRLRRRNVSGNRHQPTPSCRPKHPGRPSGACSYRNPRWRKEMQQSADSYQCYLASRIQVRRRDGDFVPIFAERQPILLLTSNRMQEIQWAELCMRRFPVKSASELRDDRVHVPNRRTAQRNFLKRGAHEAIELLGSFVHRYGRFDRLQRAGI